MGREADNAADAASRRFVIQHHLTGDGEHWDLMLEEGEVLLTWQVLAAPGQMQVGSAAARSIGDHRKAYLTCQGPLSRGRGTVHIVERGTYRMLERGPHLIHVELRGQRLRGRFALSRADADTDKWTLRPTS